MLSSSMLQDLRDRLILWIVVPILLFTHPFYVRSRAFLCISKYWMFLTARYLNESYVKSAWKFSKSIGWTMLVWQNYNFQIIFQVLFFTRKLFCEAHFCPRGQLYCRMLVLGKLLADDLRVICILLTIVYFSIVSS